MEVSRDSARFSDQTQSLGANTKLLENPTTLKTQPVCQPMQMFGKERMSLSQFWRERERERGRERESAREQEARYRERERARAERESNR